MRYELENQKFWTLVLKMNNISLKTNIYISFQVFTSIQNTSTMSTTLLKSSKTKHQFICLQLISCKILKMLWKKCWNFKTS